MLDLAEEAARRGGDVLMSYWRNLPPESVAEKARNDFVSRADRESEAAVIETILRSAPDDAILGEEGGAHPGTSGREWIVDPLDGTSNFIAGFPFWCVSIGVREHGRLAAGVVWDPLRSEMFHAILGGGAYRNGTRLRVASRETVDGAFLATGFPFRDRERIDEYLALFRELFLRARAIRRAGSAALDLAYVAAGVFDGFFEFRLSPWDIAAGAVLVQEAGGELAEFDGGTAFMTSGDVVAGPASLVADIVATRAQIIART